MKKSDKLYLVDILRAIETIETYVKNVSFSKFISKQMCHDAVMYQMEIIGEAANKLSKDFVLKYTEFPIKQAVEMRNFLIHGYSEIDLDTVWKTIKEDLPGFKKQVNEILGKLGIN